MSMKVAGEVWELDLPVAEAWVLMAYADHAHHDGTHVFPGTELIAWKTNYSERQVYRATQSLVARGILVVDIPGGGSGLVTEYHIDLSAAPRKAPRPQPKRRPAPRQPATKVASSRRKPATVSCAPPPAEKPATQPRLSENHDSLSGFSPAESLPSAPQTLTTVTETLTTATKNPDSLSPQSLTLTVNVNRHEPSDDARTRARETDAHPLTGGTMETDGTSDATPYNPLLKEFLDHLKHNLRLQVLPGAYDHLIRDLQAEFAGGTLFLIPADPLKLEWLQVRLNPLIVRTVATVWSACSFHVAGEAPPPVRYIARSSLP